jgi:hypothetical protein
MHQDVHSLDIMTDTDLVESTTVVVDEDLLLYKNAGPSAAPADSVAAQIYQWLGIAATSFPEEVCTFACVVVLHAIGFSIAQRLRNAWADSGTGVGVGFTTGRGQVLRIWRGAAHDPRRITGLPQRGARSLLAGRGGGTLG